MDAAQALSELTEVSTQIEAAVLFSADGAVQAATLEAERADRLAAQARALLDAARETEPRAEALVQLEAAVEDASVFVVRDEERAIVAVTRPEPTVGLVFFDLKSCLRAAAAEGDSDGKPRPRPGRRSAAKEPEHETAA